MQTSQSFLAGVWGLGRAGFGLREKPVAETSSSGWLEGGLHSVSCSAVLVAPQSLLRLKPRGQADVLVMVFACASCLACPAVSQCLKRTS